MKVAKLVCPQCGHEQPIDPKYDGQQFACPQCGQAASVIAQEQPLDAPPTAGPSSGKQRGASAAAAVGSIFSKGRENPLFVVQAVDAFLNKIRGGFKASWYEKLSALFSLLGQYAILLVALFCVIGSIVLAIKSGTFGIIAIGILMAFVTLFLQYMALKFLDMIDSLHENNTLYFSSQSFFDVGAASIIFMVLMMIIATVTALVTGAGAAMPPELRGMLPGAGGDWLSSLIGLGGFILFVYVQLFFLLNPRELLGVEFRSGTSGGEVFLSVMAVGIKMLLKLTPTLFGLGCIIFGSQLIYYAIKSLFTSNVMEVFGAVGAIFSAFVGVAMLPVFAYFFCIFLSFFIDIALAIMRTARNTDPKSRAGQGSGEDRQ